MGGLRGVGACRSLRFKMEKVGSWFHLCRMSSPQGRFWSCDGQEPFLGGRVGIGGGVKEGEQKRGLEESLAVPGDAERLFMSTLKITLKKALSLSGWEGRGEQPTQQR